VEKKKQLFDRRSRQCARSRSGSRVKRVERCSGDRPASSRGPGDFLRRGAGALLDLPDESCQCRSRCFCSRNCAVLWGGQTAPQQVVAPAPPTITRQPAQQRVKGRRWRCTWLSIGRARITDHDEPLPKTTVARRFVASAAAKSAAETTLVLPGEGHRSDRTCCLDDDDCGCRRSEDSVVCWDR